MKKLAIYAVLLTAALLIPEETVELGQLLPVETVFIYKENGQIVIETDTEDRGKGNSMAEAVSDLKETTAGIIFLDTADYLLLSPEVEELIPEVSRYFKESVRICYAESGINVQDATVFLASHKPRERLGGWTKKVSLQTLTIRDERFVLTEKKVQNLRK